MKRYILTLVLLIALLTACAPQTPSAPQSLLPNDDVSGVVPTSTVDVATLAIAALSKALSVPPGAITLVSTEAVEWPDGCLGIQKKDVMCTQAIVPGYRIILAANSRQYEFHTNQDGSQVEQVGEATVAGTVEEMVIDQLVANLGLDKAEVVVASTSETDFSDACMGVVMNKVACAEAITPGKIIVLESNNIQYEYHVALDGSKIQPATLALTWTRDGGIAGFCDGLTVFLSGEIVGSQCKSQPTETQRTFANLLSTEERSQFDAWLAKLGSVQLDASDPEGVSDRMAVMLQFYGNGKNNTVGKTDEQALLNWASTLFQKLYS